ncbi:MAG: DUF3096 domain-containing protein [Dehalococcoidales bacterium]|nr:DUF3096 domain-containing protein [Dehalococcoidales bacterium]
MDMTLPFIGALSVPQFILAIIAIVFGIIMLIKPQIVAYLVGIYLIIWGVLFFIGC